MTDLRGVRVGCAMTGSFCTFARAFRVWRALKAAGAELYPIMSFNAANIDTRFFEAAAARGMFEEICGSPLIQTIDQAEPIGPKKLLDALVIAPCTGNTLAKLAAGVADTPVTLAAKSHLRNGRSVLIAVSTNDGLAQAAKNIGALLPVRHLFFVPFRQDDSLEKPTSLVADLTRLPEAAAAALEERQLQPLLQAALR